MPDPYETSKGRSEVAISDCPTSGRGSRPDLFHPLMPRVLARVDIDPSTGCWNWTGYIAKDGYARLNYRGKNWLIHRAVYTELVGEIPEHLEIDHLCENTICANVEHLEAVTRQENMARSMTNPTAVNALKTHCPRGHEYNVENTRVAPLSMGRPEFVRICKECARIRAKQRGQVGVRCTSCEWNGKRAPGRESNPCPKCSAPLEVRWRREAA